LLEDCNKFQLDDLCAWKYLVGPDGSIINEEFDKILWLADLGHKKGYYLSAGSGIIWGSHEIIPEFLINGNETKEELIQVAENHISDFLTPLKDKLHRVAVANEMLHNPLGNPNFWTETKGVDRKSLMQRCYRKAREVLPNAELVLRDFSVEFDGYERSDEFFQLVADLNAEERTLNSRNLIDGVEFELPLFLDALTRVDPAMNPTNFATKEGRGQMLGKFRSNVQRFINAGLSVSVVEMFIPINHLPGDTAVEKLAVQAELYEEFYCICIEEGADIGLFRPGSDTYQYGNIDYPPSSIHHYPYPRNNNYAPLPSYYAINRAIFSTDRLA
jgi:endo-1,4-beta-xylanase